MRVNDAILNNKAKRTAGQAQDLVNGQNRFVYKQVVTNTTS